MSSPFTILNQKDTAGPPRPLILVKIDTAGGPVCLSTASVAGTTTISYNGDTYISRLLEQNVEVIQAMSEQGFDSVPSLTLGIADTDREVWRNSVRPYGWRGSTMTLTFVLYDVIAGQYSTDAIVWKFICGNPGVTKTGLTVDATSLMNMQRVKVPPVPILRLCPYAFPATPQQRSDGLNIRKSSFYQCGYAPDIAGGPGNLNGSVPYTTCDYTKGNCQQRGMFDRDNRGNVTRRFGGITWTPAVQYTGRQFTTGNKVFGFNSPNPNIFNGQYWNVIYGTQWVNGTVLAPAADPNSLRSEVIVCYAPYGGITIRRVLVNGVEVPLNNGHLKDVLFRYDLLSAGGRTGAISQDKIFDGTGDPHGSLAKIEIVVPVELAQNGSVPQVLVQVDGPPVNCIIDNGNGTYTDNYQQSTNPVWHLLDMLTTLGPWTEAQLGLTSFAVAAAQCDELIPFVNLAGQSDHHSRFRSSFALDGTNRVTLAQAVTGIRNCANLMLSPNGPNGELQCFMRGTLSAQQNAPIPGSNFNTPQGSLLANGNSGTGYYAHKFDETNIIEDTFRITTRTIADTPTRVSFSYQDELNDFQNDTQTVIDPDAYISSGNQIIDVPLQVLGIPNYDQGLRLGNVNLSESLRGNPRDDAGGTLYFEFETGMTAVHLATRLGYICALDWSQLEI